MPGVQGVQQENPEEAQDKKMKVILRIVLALAVIVILFMGINSAV